MKTIPRILPFLLALFFAQIASAGINSFTASPTTFLPGQEVTLTWSVTSGDSISIAPGVGTVSGATGSVAVIPTAQTTYTLTNSTSGTTAQAIVKPVVAPTLKNRWSFNEGGGGTAVTDSVGAQNGVIRGTGFSRSGSAVNLPGGGSGSAPYIDLPNGLISPLTDVTLEGWMTVNGSQAWSRVFDFGTGSAGELFAPGGTASGTDYLLLSAQVDGNQATKRLSMKDGAEQYVDVGDATTNGQQFHFAVSYDSRGNNGSPQVRYYKNGALAGTLNTSFVLSNITDVNNWLGRSNWTGDNNTNGSYNEFRIWNGVMSGAGIAENSAAGPDALPALPRVESFTAFPATTVFSGQSIRLSYLLANPSNTEFTASIDQGVGQVSDTSGYVTVTPAGTTTYTLSITAGATTRTQQLKITVIPAAPIAENLQLAAKYQTATPVTLVANDYNTSAASLTYNIIAQPLHGTLTGSGANRTYTPAAGYSGPDVFTYQANDGASNSNTATVNITVQPAPIGPTAVNLDETSLYTDLTSGSFAGRLQATDGNPDDTFTFTLVAGTGSTHNAWFSVVGNQLIATHDFSSDLDQTISLRVRVTDSAGNSFDQIITRQVAARPLRVRINEINYNPSRNTQRTEFVELHNPTAAAVNIGNWRLAKALDFTIPAGTVIEAGGYVVLAEDPATIEALYGVTALGPWTGGLSSDGDEIELRDAAGNTVDEVDYGVSAPWPALPNGEGPSLELVNPSLDGELGGNWRASNATLPAISYLAPASSAWKYFKGTAEASSPITAWRAEGFNDISWATGTMPMGLLKKNSDTPLGTSSETGVTFGTQLTDMATYSGGSFSTNYRCVFFRKTFNVSGAIPRALLLRVMHNDAAIVWINGVEVARFGFQPAAPTNPAYNSTAYYELGNDPWSESILLNASTVIHQGTNTIAIQGFAKPPAPRSTANTGIGQEDLANYNVFDFSVDAELRASPDKLGTPGTQNSAYATNAAPAVRSITHTPAAPKPWQPIVVAARISDPQGIGSAQLKYQVCAPGNYIPSSLPWTVAEVLADPLRAPKPNPAFEDNANWTTITMVDDGSVTGDIPGDGLFTARIPAQPHRTLIRYRIVATDLGGASVVVPSSDDPRKNFATYSYNRVPVYSAGAKTFAPETLQTLPVYQWLTRASDYSSLLAYTGGDQYGNSYDLNVLLARHYENFAGTLIVGDQVLDHTRIRLRGGNSRYAGSGKRHFRFNFPKGTELQAADERGREYPKKWEAMLFNKMFGNKGAYDFGIPYEVGGKLWSQQGVPMPESHWVHFRVVRNANETDATNGDFWGLYQALELPEGKNFLAARDLPAGNFYKMTDWQQNGEMDQRYQAKGAVDYAEDFDNARFNIHQTTSQSDMERYVNMPLWYRYNAIQEAIRHYDIFCEPTGRHRVKNLIWYFKPEANTNGFGQLWYMPYDWDASWGPNFNNGYDFVNNAVFDRTDVADSPTWALPKQNRSAMQIEHRNAIRELRDLVWYRDGSGRGPVDDMIDDALATISQFYTADMARWPAPGAVGTWTDGAPSKAQDMKNFAFTGWSDAFGADPAVGTGGRAAHLDSISDTLDAGQLPAKPTITYTGTSGYPVDGLAFASTAFSDPQGAATFGAMQWRIGEITDAAAPAYDAAAERIYEATAVWESGTLSSFNASVTIPGTALRVGHAYRARVRHRDTSGRWSHWSSPIQFIAGASNYTQVLSENLMISEFMYHPAAPDAGYAEADFEYIELVNVSPSLTLDLSNVRFTKGIDFDFAGSAITSLAPGARVLVVKNMAAFTLRYGAGKPIAGVWEALDSLSNSGEELKLSYGAGAAIHEFIYDDNSPWPEQADAGGYSLVLRNPYAKPNHAIAANWRASYGLNGTPGVADSSTFADWAAANGSADLTADVDFDGLSNLLEFALGGTNNTSDIGKLPAAKVQSLTVNGTTSNYFTLTIRRPFGREEFAFDAQFSTTLPAWNAGTLVNTTDHGDGTFTQVWRAPQPATADSNFGRIRVVMP